jgi:hypothetical protein
MNPRVQNVIPLPDFKLGLTFKNGETRIFDVKPLLDKGVFRELRDLSQFQSVHVWHGTIRWSGGQDICPDTLYEESVPALVPFTEEEMSVATFTPGKLGHVGYLKR